MSRSYIEYLYSLYMDSVWRIICPNLIPGECNRAMKQPRAGDLCVDAHGVHSQLHPAGSAEQLRVRCHICYRVI